MWLISPVLLFISASTLSFAHTEACSVSSTKGHMSVGGAEALSNVSHNKIMEVIAPQEIIQLSVSDSAKDFLTNTFSFQ